MPNCIIDNDYVARIEHALDESYEQWREKNKRIETFDVYVNLLLKASEARKRKQ
jgi:hypothetical protein